MSSRRSEVAGLLRWYPAAWRQRYGAELGALLEDTLAGRPPSRRFRLSVAWAGVRERGHQSGLVGHSRPAEDRMRAGSLVVLGAWAAFVVAGGGFAKISEHFQQAGGPPWTRSLPVAAYDVVFAGAIVAGIVVLAGAVVALPAFLGFLRARGWSQVRGHVLRAAGATALATVSVAVLAAAGHTLTPAQRNGGLLVHPVDGYYLGGFVITGLLVVATLALWTVAAVAVVRRVELRRPVLCAEAALAGVLCAEMIVMTAATALWWGAMASSAPWFLQGIRPGSPASALDPDLVVTMSLMALSSAAALYGTVRVARSWRASGLALS